MLRAIDEGNRATAAMIGPADSESVARVIEFTNVGLRYGHVPEILRDLSFRIQPGSFHFLTGPSGSGKTSLLRLLLLSLKPSRGTVRMFGRDVSALDQDSLLD